MAKQTGLNAPNRGVDEVLNQTELGGFVQKNKNLFIGILGLMVVGVIGYGVTNYMANQRVQEVDAKIFAYKQGAFKQWNDKKINETEFIGAFNSFAADIKSEAALGPVLLEVVEKLQKNSAHDKVIELLGSRIEDFKAHPYLYYILGQNLMASYEDKGMFKEAVETLEKTTASKIKVLEVKNYLDKGRLYMKSGDKEKARKNLVHIITHFSKNDYAKIAELYLSEL